MNKEKVLHKAQSTKSNTPEERETQIIQKGNGIVVFSVLMFCLILMIAKIIARQPWYDVYSIFFISMGVQNFYKGIKLKQRYAIALGVGSTIMAILILVGYIIQIL